MPAQRGEKFSFFKGSLASPVTPNLCLTSQQNPRWVRRRGRKGIAWDAAWRKIRYRMFVFNDSLEGFRVEWEVNCCTIGLVFRALFCCQRTSAIAPSQIDLSQNRLDLISKLNFIARANFFLNSFWKALPSFHRFVLVGVDARWTFDVCVG